MIFELKHETRSIILFGIFIGVVLVIKGIPIEEFEELFKSIGKKDSCTGLNSYRRFDPIFMSEYFLIFM